MMGYIFVIDFGRYINVNINYYRHSQTLTNLTGANPIIAFFLGRRSILLGPVYIYIKSTRTVQYQLLQCRSGKNANAKSFLNKGTKGLLVNYDEEMHACILLLVNYWQ